MTDRQAIQDHVNAAWLDAAERWFGHVLIDNLERYLWGFTGASHG